MDNKFLRNLFSKPSIIGVVGDINSGKTMLLYHLVEEAQKIGSFNLYTYGLKINVKNSKQIYTLDELERIKNSVILLDEVMTLFDLDNRMAKRQIENTLRLIFHNNNVLIMVMTPENVKKFIAGKLHLIILKQITIPDLINGSRIKYLVNGYHGEDKGNSVLSLTQEEAIIYDGKHYTKIIVPYNKKYDTKKENKPILTKTLKGSKKSKEEKLKGGKEYGI